MHAMHSSMDGFLRATNMSYGNLYEAHILQFCCQHINTFHVRLFFEIAMSVDAMQKAGKRAPKAPRQAAKAPRQAAKAPRQAAKAPRQAAKAPRQAVKDVE